MITSSKRCDCDLRTSKPGVSVDMVYTGEVHGLLDTVELVPGGDSNKLGEIFSITGRLDQLGEGDQVEAGPQPFTIQSIKVHISTYMNLIRLSSITIMLILVQTGLSKIEPVTCKNLRYWPKNTGK